MRGYKVKRVVVFVLIGLGIGILLCLTPFSVIDGIPFIPTLKCSNETDDTPMIAVQYLPTSVPDNPYIFYQAGDTNCKLTINYSDGSNPRAIQIVIYEVEPQKVISDNQSDSWICSSDQADFTGYRSMCSRKFLHSNKIFYIALQTDFDINETERIARSIIIG